MKFSCLKVFSIRTLFSTMAVKKILVSCPFSWNTCLGLVSFYSFYFYGVGFQCLDSFSTMPSVPRYCLLGTQPVKNSLQQSPKCLLERSHELAYIDSLSLCYNGHFPGGPGLAGTRKYPFWILLELKVMEVVVTTGAVRLANLQSNVTTNKQHPVFYRPDALPVAQPTVSKH